MPGISDIHDAARDVFGISRLFPHQVRVCSALLRGRKVFAVLPTGSGKSLNYQLPAIVSDGTAVVFSPLIALMHDQVQALQRKGVRAARLSSDMPPDDQARVLRNLRRGRYSIIYVAPERLSAGVFEDSVRNVSLIAVDECHCLSRWGRDFRPSYALIGGFVKRHVGVPLLATTATADEDVEREVARVLAMRGDYRRFVAAPYRANLRYSSTKEMPAETALEIARERVSGGDGAIIYCCSRKQVDKIAALSLDMDVTAAPYHAGMRGVDRAKVQNAFINGDVPIVVATSAFGMGVDKGNIRLILDYHVPGSIFDYVQSSGRGGRDGKPCQCILNVSKDGLRIQRFLITLSNPRWDVYQNLWRHFTDIAGRAIYDESALAKIGRVHPNLQSQALAAVRFLEFSGCLRTKPARRKYVLDVLDPDVVFDYKRKYDLDVRWLSKKRDAIVLTVHGNDYDPVDELASKGAVVYSRPDEYLSIGTKGHALKLAWYDVEEKLEKAKDKLDRVLEFAASDDKAKFLRDEFLAT